MFSWQDDTTFYADELRAREYDYTLNAEARERDDYDRFVERGGVGEAKPDPRPARRHVASPVEWRYLRAELLPGFCEVCGGPAATLHHALPKSLGGDDCRENLAPVCGDGTTGCHGDLEARRPHALDSFRRRMRPETRYYITGKIGAARLARMYPLFSERAA